MTKPQSAAYRKTVRTHRPVFLRRERRKGWSGPLPIYVLWCEDCGRFTESHPAGYGRISCATCRRTERVMTWQRFRDKELLPFLRLAPFFLALALVLAFVILSRR